MNILVVEDEQNMRKSLVQCLQLAGFTPHSVDNGIDALHLLKKHTFTAIVMDYMMPKKDGLSVCTFLRKQKNYIPIIILSGISELGSKINLLQSGADDYLTKPFIGSELIARIKAITRRPTTFHPSILKEDCIELNSILQKVTVQGKPVSLTKKEYALLEYFMRFKNIILSRGEIMEHVWDRHIDPFSNTLEAHVLSLRKKLGSKRKTYLQCISGRGYVFHIPSPTHENSS